MSLPAPKVGLLPPMMLPPAFFDVPKQTGAKRRRGDEMDLDLMDSDSVSSSSSSLEPQTPRLIHPRAQSRTQIGRALM
jgi:hypothetical protein